MLKYDLINFFLPLFLADLIWLKQLWSKHKFDFNTSNFFYGFFMNWPVSGDNTP